MKFPDHYTVTCPIEDCGAKIKLPMVTRQKDPDELLPGYATFGVSIDRGPLRRHVSTVHHVKPPKWAETEDP
jgi:hypothetical protein